MNFVQRTHNKPRCRDSLSLLHTTLCFSTFAMLLIARHKYISCRIMQVCLLIIAFKIPQASFELFLTTVVKFKHMCRFRTEATKAGIVFGKLLLKWHYAIPSKRLNRWDFKFMVTNVFRIVASCGLVDSDEISEDRTASIIRAVSSH